MSELPRAGTDLGSTFLPLSLFSEDNTELESAVSCKCTRCLFRVILVLMEAFCLDVAFVEGGRAWKFGLGRPPRLIFTLTGQKFTSDSSPERVWGARSRTLVSQNSPQNTAPIPEIPDSAAGLPPNTLWRNFRVCSMLEGHHTSTQELQSSFIHLQLGNFTGNAVESKEGVWKSKIIQWNDGIGNVLKNLSWLVHADSTELLEMKSWMNSHPQGPRGIGIFLCKHSKE